MSIQQKKVHNNWVVVSPATSAKTGLVMPTADNMGTVMNVGFECSVDIRATLGKTVYFGGDFKRIDYGDIACYIMEPKNIYFSDI